MDSGLYAAYTGLMARTQALDTAANNLANAGTNGFRAERDYFRGILEDGAGADGAGSQVGGSVNGFGVLGGNRLDFGQGDLAKTGNPLDVALRGDGFFAVQTSTATLYTRDGGFSLSAAGVLQTAQGEQVLDVKGKKITVPTGAVSISSDGTISVSTDTGSAIVGQIGVFNFADKSVLQAAGGSRLAAAAGAVPTAGNAEVEEGAVEGSNENSVMGTMQLVLVQRQAEMMQKALTVFNNDFDKTAAEDLTSIGLGREQGLGNGIEQGEIGGGMIRALYTAASGMSAQQANLDTVANNLANSATTGFRSRSLQFEDMIYQNLVTPGSAASQQTVSAGLQIGLGTKSLSSEVIMTQGDFNQTGNQLDLAISGAGFFQVQMPNGTIAYTRNGNFSMNNAGTVVDANGNQLLPALTIPANATAVTISQYGVVSATLPGQTVASQLGTVQLATFPNPGGLNSIGANLLQPTGGSGNAITDVPGGSTGMGTLQQGYLENSNVDVVGQFVSMILAQRAYESNSKVVHVADDMYSQVNGLIR